MVRIVPESSTSRTFMDQTLSHTDGQFRLRGTESSPAARKSTVTGNGMNYRPLNPTSITSGPISESNMITIGWTSEGKWTTWPFPESTLGRLIDN